MKQRTRTSNSILNLTIGFISQIITVIFGFAVRAVFIKCLSEDYLGANGLYSNVLSMLSLAELGFGTAIVYSMYKPFAKKDYGKIAQLLKLYKKVYIIVGTAILIFGLSIVPFMGIFIKDKPDIEGLELYYVLYLLNTVASYWFFAYHQSILQADQKSYVLSSYYSAFNILKDLFQIVSLILFRSYLAYLIIQIICKILENISIRRRIKKEYPKIYKRKVVEDLSKKEQKKIFRDVKALMLNKFSHVILNCTDNIIISSIVGLKWVGILSNYVLVTTVVSNVLCQVTAAVQASLGNFFAKKDAEQGYNLFKKIDFLNFWLYGFSITALISLLNPFMTLWIGEKYTLSTLEVIIVSANFFIAGFLNTTWTFRTTLGLFTQGKYRPLIAAILNVVLSVLMGIEYGIVGVLSATTISRLLLNVWYDPWVIHKYGFNKPIRPYYAYTIKRILLLIITIVSTYLINRLFILSNGINFISFFEAMIVTTILPNAIFLFTFYRNTEFKDLVFVAKFVIVKTLKKMNLMK